MMKKLALIVLILLLMPLSMFAQGDDEEEPNFIVSPDGNFAAILPVGWVGTFDVEEATFASSEEALELLANAEDDVPLLPAGEYGIQVAVFDAEIMALLELAPDVSMVEFMTTFLMLLEAEESDFPELTEPEEIELVPGRAAAISRGSEDGAEFAVLAYNIAPGIMSLALIVGVEGELFAVEQDVLALLEGILYSAPLDETYEDDAIEINYPTGWEANQVQAGIYTFTNVPEKLELGDEGGHLEVGEYIMAIYNLTELGVEEMDLADLLVAVGQDLLEEDEEDSFTEVVQIPLEDRELYGMTVIQADEGESGGGILITRANTGEILIVVYTSVVGQEPMVSWTAVNMLLQVDLKQQ